MKKRTLLLLLVASCTADSTSGIRIERSDRDADGLPYMLHGALGTAAPIQSLADAEAVLRPALPELTRAVHLPADQLIAARVTHDRIGMTHVIYKQVENGMRVVGGSFAVHVATSGTIIDITNGARDASKAPIDPVIAASFAAEASRLAVADGDADAGVPELVYVIAHDDLTVHLAWETLVKARHDIARDKIYVDAITGAVVDRRPTAMALKTREVYDMQGGTYPTDFNSAIQIASEGSPPTDPAALGAYDNTGATYDCYHDLFTRDSYDDMGATLASIVHLTFQTQNGTSPNNAVWDGQEMVFGDGDGTTMSETSRAFDVTAHELTHAVTEATAGLVYQGESGALNEAMSDILSATCEARKNGGANANTWLVGEDIWTPNTPGDALRYMANPTQDASQYPPGFGSRDYYPEKFSGQQDNGGVHFNSGIANLAFYLLSAGGPHPRAKTPYTVVGIGIDKAGAIFERALTNGYIHSNTNFAAARTATETAATDLYPGAAKTAVSMAWATVGVGAALTEAMPPTVHITSPMTGANLAAGFSVTADAMDDQGVLRV
ncbi:MAG: M4 family metallopeptidase, partial [Kofleriaceae bacterium]